jgi:hypothetical protein
VDATHVERRGWRSRLVSSLRHSSTLSADGRVFLHKQQLHVSYLIDHLVLGVLLSGPTCGGDFHVSVSSANIILFPSAFALPIGASSTSLAILVLALT